jgi:hypothetical protein
MRPTNAPPLAAREAIAGGNPIYEAEKNENLRNARISVG